MGRILKAFVVLVTIGFLDVVLFDGINYDPVACKEIGVRRAGLHQGKNEAYFLYFFIAHVYDSILNPWHWTDDMRTESLTSGDFNLSKGLKVVDVGAGTGFTTIGVLQQGVSPQDVHMLDQSPQQLSKAAAKSELKDVAAMMEGDAENLPMNWTGKFDRYVSAGSIEYWPHPQQAINEAARVLENNGKAMIIGPIRATNPISRFFADMWYLFPQEDEYIAWFKSAGFVDIHIHRVTPDWYQGDRTHGLIMGCAVTGTKPNDWAPPASPNDTTAQNPPVHTASLITRVRNSALASTMLSLPRFALGSVASVYYAVLPIAIFAKNVYSGSM